MGLRHAYRKERNGRLGWALRFTFDAEQIEALKKAIPAYARSYSGDEEREWWLSLEFEDELLQIFPEMDAYVRQLPLL